MIGNHIQKIHIEWENQQQPYIRVVTLKTDFANLYTLGKKVELIKKIYVK